ncbi:MAG: ImmA/IrrE family metallo-endopeptidase [Planctomycetota bacterium]
MVDKARSVALRAQELGWDGPPYDPLVLADLLKIKVAPRTDVEDARTIPLGNDRFIIEYNPERPHGRLRYSIAHEIAHTFFPDASEAIRNRLPRSAMKNDEWQLEMLCNLGAAELLMPVGSFRELISAEYSIARLMDYRKEFGVSAEALLNRVVRLATIPCAMFAASCRPSDTSSNNYRVDYSIGSPYWGGTSLTNQRVPNDSAVTECTAIGWTARGIKEWQSELGPMQVESAGIPPYPGQTLPRVVALFGQNKQRNNRQAIWISSAGMR